LIEDAKWELAILATVHGFYQKLLRDHFDGDIPIPAGLDTDSLALPNDESSESLTRMRRWLCLLDMAITPAMVRCALSADTDPEMAEGLLRYYARKNSPELDRDKADLVATFLYRNPRVPGQWERRGYALDGILPIPPFEIALAEILADGEAAPLAAEDLHRLAELDLLRAKVETVRDFGALLDSGALQKVRDIKRSFGPAFFHPGILAYIGPFNTAFGKRFDTLFRATAAEIRDYAKSVEERGGSIVGQVDGVDVTVDLVLGMDEMDILRTDYSTSLERFARVAQLKKSMHAQPKMRAAAAAATQSKPFVHGRVQKANVTPKPTPPRVVIPANADPKQITLEETKLRTVEESIRAFVRAASPKLREIVPMRFFNLLLTSAEADAYCADYLEEDSFRAENARILVRVVAIVARISTELEELKRARLSGQCQSQANSLVVLLAAAKTARENAELITETAVQRGLTEKVITMNASIQKLRERVEIAEKTLSELARVLQ
jgi:hypothetical protein